MRHAYYGVIEVDKFTLTTSYVAPTDNTTDNTPTDSSISGTSDAGPAFIDAILGNDIVIAGAVCAGAAVLIYLTFFPPM